MNVVDGRKVSRKAAKAQRGLAESNVGVWYGRLRGGGGRTTKPIPRFIMANSLAG